MLLTFAIPTFNRPETLFKLVTSIVSQVDNSMEGMFEIVILDNASDCDLSVAIEAAKNKNVNFRYIRHESNLGMDQNIILSYQSALSKYVWVMGDDDFIAPGGIALIKKILERNPSMVFLEPIWFQEHEKNIVVKKALPRIYALDAEAMIRKAGAYLTFLTSVIVKRDEDRVWAPRYSGTYLPQLEWVLGALMLTQKFEMIYVNKGIIFARAGSSGGYGLYDVFGTNLRKVLDDKFGNQLAQKKLLMKKIAWGFLLGLAWSLRQNRAGHFSKPSTSDVAKIELAYGQVTFFGCAFRIVSSMPLGIARVVKRAASAYIKIVSWQDKRKIKDREILL